MLKCIETAVVFSDIYLVYLGKNLFYPVLFNFLKYLFMSFYGNFKKYFLCVCKDDVKENKFYYIKHICSKKNLIFIYFSDTKKMENFFKKNIDENTS